MVNLSVQCITNEIDYYGESVTLRTITDSEYSDWGDATEGTSNASKNAFVQVLTQEDELVKEAIFQSGDKIFWFKGDETNIARGNRIQHNSLWVEITEIIEHDAAGTTFIREARTKKV